MLELNKVYNMDCIEGMKLLPDNSIDSIVTDPPYEIGFMGKGWDSTGIANNVDMRKECLRVLKPGGHLLSFAATRTYHRMAVAIEDAGFEVRDMIEWVYGSGFPKSLNIAKMLDKMEGVEHPKNTPISDNGSMSGANYTRNKMDVQSDLAKEWEGWGTALKPAHEPICMARKPLEEKTIAENVLKYGTGGLNIDGTRVEVEPGLAKNWTDRKAPAGFNGDKSGIYGSGKTDTPSDYTPTGRFPANLIHDNSEEVRECFPDSKGGAFPKTHGSSGFVSPEEKQSRVEMNDSGNASRFFKSIIYQAKASKSERNKGCEELEEKPKVFNGQSDKPSTEMKDVEKRFTTLPKANNHPTVKPITLMEYLIKMVTKEGGTVLDPFMGSGTTALACKNINRKFIGFELEKEYVEIANARIKEEQVGLFTM